MSQLPVIALDFSTKKEVEDFLNLFPEQESLYLKVGMELFYQEGPDMVKWLKACGHSVFLDLKLHDIPNTVERAMKGLATLGVDMTNVHAAGGVDMMKAAKRGLEAGTPAGGQPPVLIAVTQLTSTSEAQMQRDQLIPVALKDSVTHYAQCAEQAGLDGVVCSAWEVADIKESTRQTFVCLTPGIRPEGSAVGDQQRVMTPREARRIGSDFIVVGRPVTKSQNPYEAYLAIKNEWNEDR